MMRLASILALAATLTACGDKAQTLSGTKRDGAAFEGTTNPYNAPGWKAGDKTSWEQQLKARTQHGQNEYTRVN